jgi:hypothetical protein
MSTKFFAAIAGLTLAFMAQASWSGEYHSHFNFPTIQEKNKVYRFNVPFTFGIPEGVRSQGVSWSWSFHGHEQPILIELCQMVSNQCLDVSWRQSGTTELFNQFKVEFPFYFNVKAYRSPFFAINNLKGELRVTW